MGKSNIEQLASYDLELMAEVAELYYKNNLKQESIARRLSISKYKVNRVLKKAIARGIVQINIIRPKNRMVKK